MAYGAIIGQTPNLHNLPATVNISGNEQDVLNLVNTAGQTRVNFNAGSVNSSVALTANNQFQFNSPIYTSKITGLATPVNNSDGVNKQYVDGQVSNLQTQINSIGGGWQEVERYTTHGSYTFTASRTGYYGAFIVGGGQSGQYQRTGVEWESAQGGQCGSVTICVIHLTQNQQIPIVVGQGGARKNSEGAANIGTQSSFGSLVAMGGGQSTTLPEVNGINPNGYGEINTFLKFNPFTNENCLGNGANAQTTGTNSYFTYKGSKNPLTGLGGGDGHTYGDDVPSSSPVIPGEDATEYGCGGGAFVYSGWNSHNAYAGAGADGAVFVYYKASL